MLRQECMPPQQISPSAASRSPWSSAIAAASRNVAAMRSVLTRGSLSQSETLQLESNHGWGISLRIQQISNDVLSVNQGSLYPALARLEEQGLISAKWGVSDNNRRARFYELTAAGRRQLAAEREAWERFSAALGLILDAG